jgi:hypothetical protein
MGAIVAFWQQHEFANAVPKPVGSESATHSEIPQHAAEFQLFILLFASAGSTKSRLREHQGQLSQP